MYPRPPDKLEVPFAEDDPLRPMLARMRQLADYHRYEWGGLLNLSVKADDARCALAGKALGREVDSLAKLTAEEYRRVGDYIRATWPEACGY